MSVTRQCGNCHRSYTIENADQVSTGGSSVEVICPYCHEPDGSIVLKDGECCPRFK